MKQEIAKFSGRLKEMRKGLGEVVLVRIDKKVNKIDENVAVISGTVDRWIKKCTYYMPRLKKIN